MMLRLRKSRKEDGSKGSEPEEQIIGAVEEEEVPQVKCDVALSPTEAHAHLGKGSKSVSYEDLYGSPSPKKEDAGMTTRELKDFIHDQINELEQVEE